MTTGVGLKHSYILSSCMPRLKVTDLFHVKTVFHSCSSIGIFNLSLHLPPGCDSLYHLDAVVDIRSRSLT